MISLTALIAIQVLTLSRARRQHGAMPGNVPEQAPELRRINALSRAIIRAIKREYGAVWLWDGVATWYEYRGGMVWNFAADYASPDPYPDNGRRIVYRLEWT